MKLPYAANARVDRKKVVEYLLSSSHPDGSSKARFFSRFGFRVDEWNIFARALRKHAKVHVVSVSMESTHGTRHSVDGILETPDGRNPEVRTVWILTKRSRAPRLITAHPI
jgi:uncharacterized protein DUF6883